MASHPLNSFPAGEGGTFALYQGLYPPERKQLIQEDITSEDEKMALKSPLHNAKSVAETPISTAPPKFQWVIFIWVRFVHTFLPLVEFTPDK